MGESLVLHAPAKINLGLALTGRYENGYHRLETIFVPVTLFDKITVQRAATDSVRYFWPHEADAETQRMLALGAAKNPLLHHALAALRQYIEVPPLSITVEKRIPSPGGLGGASADAAALIAGLWRQVVPTRAMPPKLIAASEELGADIPFFLAHGLAGRAARLSGIGHELTAVKIPRLCGWLCVPAFGFPTAQMFAEVRQWDLPPATSGSAEGMGKSHVNLALRLNEIPYSDEPIRGVRVLQNDFDRAALAVFPAEGRRLTRAKLTLAQAARQFFPHEWVVGMTGSGAGLFAATEAGLPVRSLTALKPLLQTRLGRGWQVFPFTNIGP